MSARTQLPAESSGKPKPSRAEEIAGTHVLPMPDACATVAGMPRRARSFTDPGDPGIIRPEDDVYANDPHDLSEER